MPDTGLSPEAATVVSRWNPDGLRQLSRASVGDPGNRTVAVVDPTRADRNELVDELTAIAPDLQFADSPADAAVVLILLDAAAPLGGEALQMVDRLASSGTGVLFALQRIDAHRDWRTVRERNAQLLARHAGTFADAPIWPVSVRLARLARTGGARTDVMMVNSGLVELHGALAAELSSRPEHAARLAGAADNLADRTRRMIAAKADSIRHNDDTAELRAERATLLTRRDGGRTEAAATLRSQVQLARVELTHEVGSRVRSVNVAARSDIDSCDRDQLAEFPERLDAAVARIAGDLDAYTRQRLSDLQATLKAETWPAAESPGYLDVGDRPEPRHRGVEDRMMIAVGASAGVGIGRLVVSPLTMVPALDIATIPVTLLLGGCAAWWLTRSRGQIADRAHLRQWAADALINVKSQLEQRVLAALVETEAQLSEHVGRAGSARALEVDRQVAGIDAEIRRRSARRAAQLASCERDLEVIGRHFAARGTDRRFGASNTSS
ncbi:hypothetical protein [Antrihabitans cavernicola]|uniref:Uncharacterized protein n=1 Tax=Antrihabitans cavernicola TaxID=2495913 RepID=A0A5A7S1G4_9NOCA|nr:hypothetical protein [Spelaeibacter cavernicola]KAA0016307.1 hypothetical protein FOY51_26500 [Spelaeibacter cavernicola]